MRRCCGTSSPRTRGPAVCLTLPQLRLLQALAAMETGIALTTQLARQMDVTVPTMTSRIDGLVERGFVERRPDPASRRQVHLLLTPSGRAHLDRCQTLIRARLRELLAPLTAAQKERLLLALQDLALLLAPGEAGGGRRRSEESEQQEGEVFGMVNNFVVLPLYFLSSAQFPLTHAPTWIQVLAALNPLAYAVNLLRGLLDGVWTYGGAVDLAVIGGFALIALGAATAVFAQQESRTPRLKPGACRVGQTV